MVATTFLAVPALLACMLYSLSEWGEQKLDFILKKDDTYHPQKPGSKRAYVIFMIFIGIGGTILEIVSRHALILWAETFVTASIAISVASKMWTHKHTVANYHQVPEEKTRITPNSLIKLAIIHTLLGGGLTVILLVYLMATS
jgi:hypothetical protein